VSTGTGQVQALDPDDCLSGPLIDQPVDQLPVALRAVGDAQRVNQPAALVDERDCVRALVNVDADDQRDLLARQ
jgi:hypothetical protein